MDQDATWHGARPRPRRLCVRWGPCSPSQKGDEAPQIFGPCLLCQNGLIDHPAPPPQKGGGAPTQFSAHVYCGQTAAWIKMPLGTEVGFGANGIVLDGDPVPPSPKREHNPLANFRPMSIVAKLLDGSRWHLAGRWALIQATLCYMGTQLLSPQKGTEPPPIFGPCLLWLNGWMELRRHLIRK